MKSGTSKASNQRSKKSKSMNAVHRAVFESLEVRQMMTATTYTWSGTSGSNYSTGGNWVGGTAPGSGAAVVFPSTASNKTVSFDSITVGSANISGNYSLGNSGFPTSTMVLSGTLVANGTISMTGTEIELAQNSTVEVDSGRLRVAFLGSTSSTNHAVTKTGAGELDVANYSGGINVMVAQAGTLTLESGTPGSAIMVYAGATFNGGQVAVINNVSGTVYGGFSNYNPLEATTLNFSSQGTFGGTFTLGTQLATVDSGGYVTLGGALNLTLSGTPTLGSTYTLIKNNTGSAVTGTFANLPEGSSVTIGGYAFTISYSGGSSGQDVTLTRENPVETWTGSAGDGNWNTAGNWNTDAVPTSGQDVVFPDLGNGSYENIDLGDTQISVGDVSIESNYAFTGEPDSRLNFGGTVTASGNVDLSGTYELGSHTVFNIASGYDVDIDGTALEDGYSDTDQITKTGEGVLLINGQGSGLGEQVDVQQGTFENESGYPGVVSVSNDGVYTGGGEVGGLNFTGGTLIPESFGQPANFSVGGDLSMNDQSALDLQMSGNGSEISVGEISDGNSVSLGNAQLQVSTNNLTPSIGQVFTIIDNSQGNGVSGTFAGLAEGATFTSGSTTFKISYAGGESGKEVTLTVVPHIDVWTGSGDDGLWNDPSNWNGNAVPQLGDDVDFPANSTPTTVTINGGAEVVVDDVSFEGNYTLTDDADERISLVDISATGSQVNSTIDAPVDLQGNATINVGSGAQLTIDSIYDGGIGYDVDKTGAGTLFLTGPSTYTGDTIIDDGRVLLDNQLMSNVTVNSGTQFGGSGQINNLTSNGGTLTAAYDGQPTTLNAQTVTLDSSTTLNALIDSNGNVSTIDANTGTVELGGATLNTILLGQATPTANQAYTVIDNQTGNAVDGTFNGLAEGDTFTVGNYTFQISYQGGASGQDVTITNIPTTDTWTGAAGNDEWNTASNWDGGFVPHTGDNVVFPVLGSSSSSSSQAGTNEVDISSDVKVQNIDIQGDYNFEDSGSGLVNFITVTGNVSDEGNSNVYDQLKFDNPSAITVSAGKSLQVDNPTGQVDAIAKEGDGLLELSGSNVSGPFIVQHGTIDAYGTIGSDFDAEQDGTLAGTGTLNGEVEINGGTISPGDAFGPSTITATNGISMINGGVFSEEIAAATSSSTTSSSPSIANGQLVVTGGTVQLNSASLDVDLSNVAPQIGDVYTVISNQTGTPVDGTFTGLPEGTVLRSGGYGFQISYVGGTSGNDVTLTVVHPTDTWTGAGTDNNWSDAANWSANTVPADGDDVVIDGSLAPNGVNVDVAPTVTKLTLSDNAILSGSPITVNNAISSTGDINQMIDDLRLGASIEVQASEELVIAGNITDAGNGDGITFDGGGDVVFGTTTSAGSISNALYTGDTTIDDNTAVIGKVNFSGNVVLRDNGRFEGYGSANSIDAADPNGTTILWIRDNSNSLATVTTLSNGLHLNSGSRLIMDVVGTQSNGIGPSQIHVTGGTVDLNGASFHASLHELSAQMPNVGDVYTMIKNDTGAAVNGTFAGLPEGSTFTSANVTYKISYAGGDSGQDVTLTVMSIASTTTTTTTTTTTIGTTPTVASVMPATTTGSVRPAISVEGADTSSLGETGLTYTWSVMHQPSGAKAVSFANNGTNAAKSTTARFKKAGTYVLNCTIMNRQGNSVNTQVTMTIKQVETGLRLSPHASNLKSGSITQFSGIVLDQFKHVMRTASAAAYKVLSGSASINSTGELTAGDDKGHLVVQIKIDDLTGTVGATVV